MATATVEPVSGTPLAGSPVPTASTVGTPAAATPAGPAAHVDIQLFEFAPKVTEVRTGTTVTWTNRDAIIHSITNGNSPTPAGGFDSGFFDLNQTYSFTFTQPGSYPYFCMRHPFMQGEIKVSPAS